MTAEKTLEYLRTIEELRARNRELRAELARLIDTVCDEDREDILATLYTDSEEGHRR